MASKIIYPPIVPNYLPAFDATGEGQCNVPFSLSKFNVTEDFSNLQVSIMKHGNGKSVINNVDGDDNRLRANGKIILNVPYISLTNESNRYYFTIEKQDIQGGAQEIGATYKVQIRLSKVTCNTPDNQSKWLNDNASEFSEQSTVCIIKAVGKTYLDIGAPFDYHTKEDIANGQEANIDTIATYSYSSIQIGGRVTNDDPGEKLYSYNLKLYQIFNGDEENAILIEDSGLLFSNKYQGSNEFDYFFKKEFQDEKRYKIEFTYTTVNEYTGVQKKVFDISYALESPPDMWLVTVDNGNFKNYESHYHDAATVHNSPSYEVLNNEPKDEIATDTNLPQAQLHSLSWENEEGCIGLKLKANQSTMMSGNFCIRRSDERSNFTEQRDIKILNLSAGQVVDDLEPVYDFTVESGVLYKYGVVEIDNTGKYSLMNSFEKPIMRDFEYSYLLGKGGQQLKLKFDNTMQSFKIQQMESKMDSIGSKYPMVTRNAAVEYRTFPVTGLISCQMDENTLFFSKSKAYGKYVYEHNKEKTEDEQTNEDYYYNYVQERDFRKEVLRFLQDGEPKLFKSTTEGNIIVRLMDVNCTPNQSLGRMIYSFTSNAFELDEANMENYLKYGFYEVGEWKETNEIHGTAIGQLSMDFDINSDDNFSEDIISLIYNKYGVHDESYNIGDYIKKIQKVYQIKITINDRPLRVQAVGGGLMVGNNIRVEGIGGLQVQTITILNGRYDFDKNIDFNNSTKLYLLGDLDKTVTTVNANIDFLYDYTIEQYKGKKKETQTSQKGVGQIIDVWNPGDSIQNMIYYKYYKDTLEEFSVLQKIPSIEIEANPGVIISIKDESEMNPEVHELNSTGILRIYDLTNIKQIYYVGIRDTSLPPDTGYINRSISAPIAVTYYYTVLKGTYKKENKGNG